MLYYKKVLDFLVGVGGVGEKLMSSKAEWLISKKGAEIGLTF